MENSVNEENKVVDILLLVILRRRLLLLFDDLIILLFLQSHRAAEIEALPLLGVCVCVPCAVYL
jgi:hypothetical protein